MGIPGFFPWLKRSAPRGVVRRAASLDVDTFAFDMNGIFHPAAQKVFGYGSYSSLRKSRAFAPPSTGVEGAAEAVARETMRIIDDALKIVRPQKRVLLCVDGVAGMAKQQQQRRRRYGNTAQSPIFEGTGFAPNAITPGTPFMRLLCGNIEKTAAFRASSKGVWNNLEVVWSSELSPGEGEHKIMNFLRSTPGVETESMCIHGLDADLIMLSMLHSHRTRRMYLFRDDRSSIAEKPGRARFTKPFELVDAVAAKQYLESRMPRPPRGDSEAPVRDFVFLAFIIGNDFLPHSPSHSVYRNGVDLLLKRYGEIRRAGAPPIVKSAPHSPLAPPSLRMNSLAAFFRANEKDEAVQLLETAREIEVGKSHPWEALTKNVKKGELDMESFKSEYYEAKFGAGSAPQVAEVCLQYLRGMQWVLQYYVSGIPSWRWRYAHVHAPFMAELADAASLFRRRGWKWSAPLSPFEQLVFVLPPQSAERMLPAQLSSFVRENEEWFPEEGEKDVEGVVKAREEWEGKTVLPEVPVEEALQLLRDVEEKLGPAEKQRNSRKASSLFSPRGSSPFVV